MLIPILGLTACSLDAGFGESESVSCGDLDRDSGSISDWVLEVDSGAGSGSRFGSGCCFGGGGLASGTCAFAVAVTGVYTCTLVAKGRDGVNVYYAAYGITSVKGALGSAEHI